MSQRDVSAVHCLSVWDVRGSSSELVLASPSSLQTLRGWPAVAVNSPWGGGFMISPSPRRRSHHGKGNVSGTRTRLSPSDAPYWRLGPGLGGSWWSCGGVPEGGALWRWAWLQRCRGCSDSR